MFRYAGQVYRISDLPKSYGDLRWVIQRKQLVAAAVLAGSLNEETAKQQYRMLGSELRLWCGAVQAAGSELIRTSRAYNESKGQGWEFPECALIMTGDFAFADHYFQSVSVPRHRNSLVLRTESGLIQFTELESDLLRVLLSYRGTVIPSEMLMYYRQSQQPSTRPPDQKIIDVVICKIRNKLRQTNLGQQLVSVWGRGYMLLE